MTACRASALAALLCAALALAAAVEARAQALPGRPMRLIPGGDAMPAPSVPPVDRGIRLEGAPKPVDQGASGLIDASSGALPPTLWTGSQRRAVDPLVESLAAPRQATLRDLLRRTLASPGQPPEKGADEAFPDFSVLRARGLLRLGEADAAGQLAMPLARGQRDEAARAVLRDALFLAADFRPACELVRESIAAATQPGWAHALIACQVLDGDVFRAQLGSAMLREQKMPGDDWLERFVALADGASRALEGGKAELLAHHVPLFAAAKAAPPPATLASAGPAILAAIAGSEAFAIDARLRAAEAATASGSMDGARLATLYEAVQFAPREAADLAGFAEREAGPRGRAALHRLVRDAAPGPARAAAFARALQSAERRGAARALRRAAADLVLAIPPAHDSLEHAGLLARTLLVDRRSVEAMRWFEVMRGAPEAADAAALLAPLLAIAGVPDRGLANGDALRAWREAQARREPARAAARTRLLAETLEALGTPALELGAPGAPAAIQAPAPLVRLARASGQRLVGEGVLLAAAALHEPTLRDNPSALAATLRALQEIGLADEARGIALEAVLAAGL